MALAPAQLNTPIRTRRKGVVCGVVPNPLPLSKLDVVEYATELLLLPRLANWRLTGPDPFRGMLVRG